MQISVIPVSKVSVLRLSAARNETRGSPGAYFRTRCQVPGPPRSDYNSVLRIHAYPYIHTHPYIQGSPRCSFEVPCPLSCSVSRYSPRLRLLPAPPALIPLPAAVTWKPGQCKLGSVIATDGACKQEGELLAAMLHAATGIDFKVHSGSAGLLPPGDRGLVLVVADRRSIPGVGNKEGYRLRVTPDQVEITAHRRPASSTEFRRCGNCCQCKSLPPPSKPASIGKCPAA